MNFVGIVCALIGLFITYWEYWLNTSPHHRKWAIFPQVIVILTPYLLVLFSWLFQVKRETKAGVYDEKQRHDMTKAGITTWLISLPAMTFLFFWNYQNISGPGSILWFPAYIFITVLTFSASSLIYFKRA